MHFHGKKSAGPVAFVVRYLPAPRLRQAGLTMNGKQNNRSVTSPVRPVADAPTPLRRRSEVSKGERDFLP